MAISSIKQWYCKRIAEIASPKSSISSTASPIGNQHVAKACVHHVFNSRTVDGTPLTSDFSLIPTCSGMTEFLARYVDVISFVDTPRRQAKEIKRKRESSIAFAPLAQSAGFLTLRKAAIKQIFSRSRGEALGCRRSMTKFAVTDDL